MRQHRDSAQTQTRLLGVVHAREACAEGALAGWLHIQFSDSSAHGRSALVNEIGAGI